MGLKVGKREKPGDLIKALARDFQKGRDTEAVARDREAVKVGGLRAFVRLAWPMIDPAPFRDNWHIGAICEHLDACRLREIQRLIINVPPGTSKSKIASVLWEAHTWTEDPTWAWINASYAPKLATRDGRLQRDLVSSEWYRSRWPEGAVDDLQSLVHFTNASGGWRLSTSPGSVATGYHADGQVVDDPTKPRDAREAKTTDVRAKLEEVKDWWSGTMSTRAKNIDRLVRVIIMQRVHDMDLSGAMLEEGGYEHLILPMEFNPKIFCHTKVNPKPDPRTEPGELLDPVRFPRDSVDKLRADLKDAASAQLDQDPVPPGGGLFKEEFFAKRWTLDTLPKGLIIFTSWDLRFKDDAEKGSFVVGQAWGYLPGRAGLYLLSQVRGRWSYADSKDQFRTFAGLWTRALVHLIENKANGPALKSDLEIEGFNIELVDPMGPKILRANVSEPHWKTGNVWLPAFAAWVPEFVKEHTRFPRGVADDQVDAASQAIAWATQQGSQIGEYLAGIEAAVNDKRFPRLS